MVIGPMNHEVSLKSWNQESIQHNGFEAKPPGKDKDPSTSEAKDRLGVEWFTEPSKKKLEET